MISFFNDGRDMPSGVVRTEVVQFDLVVSSRKQHCRTSWSASTSEAAKERKTWELREMTESFVWRRSQMGKIS